jgi:periplasmic protein TonB
MALDSRQNAPRGQRRLARSHAPEDFWLEPQRIKGPMMAAALLHLGAAIALIAWSVWFTTQHGNQWGGAVSASGAVQATLVSNAPSIPIPSPQTPTDNVLATETPSPAPAPPAAETQPQTPPPDAIPIPEKVTPPKPAQKPQPLPAQAKPAPKVETQARTKPLPIPRPENRATFGEAAPANIPRATTNTAGAGPVSVMGDFGSRFGWYVDVIKRKAGQNWYRAEVDPRTPVGTRVFVTFDIARDGSPSHVRIEKSSGSASLDSSALRAIQRVDTFGPLPGGYNQSSLNVEYYFEF